jgi:hypothetical protein
MNLSELCVRIQAISPIHCPEELEGPTRGEQTRSLAIRTVGVMQKQEREIYIENIYHPFVTMPVPSGVIRHTEKYAIQWPDHCSRRKSSTC